MKIIPIILLSVFLLSCNQNLDKKEVIETSNHEIQIQKNEGSNSENKEDFENLEIQEFNTSLAKEKKELSAKDVMRLYYPIEVENSEGKEEITIIEKTLDNGHILVTLIHDNQMDDSVKGEKLVMELSKINDTWKALSIKKNWKCYDGRGHTDWSTEFCL